MWILAFGHSLSLQPVRASGNVLATLAVNIKRSRVPRVDPHSQNLHSITTETHFRLTTSLIQDALSHRLPLRSSAPRNQPSCWDCSRASRCRDRCRPMFVLSEEIATRSDTNVFLVDLACNCPNNCKHKVGSSCKYHNDDDELVTGGK